MATRALPTESSGHRRCEARAQICSLEPTLRVRWGVLLCIYFILQISLENNRLCSLKPETPRKRVRAHAVASAGTALPTAPEGSRRRDTDSIWLDSVVAGEKGTAMFSQEQAPSSRTCDVGINLAFFSLSISAVADVLVCWSYATPAVVAARKRVLHASMDCLPSRREQRGHLARRFEGTNAPFIA